MRLTSAVHGIAQCNYIRTIPTGRPQFNPRKWYVKVELKGFTVFFYNPSAEVELKQRQMGCGPRNLYVNR